MTAFVVGGAGYVGSHVCQALAESGFVPVVFDDLSGGYPWAVQWGPFVQGSLHDKESLKKAFKEYQPVGVLHLASFIDVRESLIDPGKYYQNNLVGTVSLLQAMVEMSVPALVFSSSAAVYGIPHSIPIAEDHPKSPVNPYGRSKWMAEEMLQDFSKAHGLSSMSLRYFNAAGAAKEGKIGEAHSPETHLIPLTLLTALKKRPHLSVYGTDHPTQDGTAVRDYIHVLDLADAHIKGLKWLLENRQTTALNIGTGIGHSVREVIHAAEKITGIKIPLEIRPRSSGDPPALVADSTKAKSLLGWEPKYSDLTTILETAWKWHNR